MNALNVENGQDVQASAVEMIDCGRASVKTQGLPFLVVFELAIPPFNTQLFP